MAYKLRLQDLPSEVTQLDNQNYQLQASDLPDEENMVGTFIGKLPRPDVKKDLNDQDLIKEMIRTAIGAPGASQLFSPVTKKSIVKLIQGTHDSLEKQAENGFKHVSAEVSKRGINKIPPNDEINLTELKEYFPNTKQSKSLLNDVKNGDYNALRKVQSDLYKRGKQNLQSDFETDRMRGEEMLDIRDSINKSIQEHLINTGNNDLAGILSKSRKDYRTLQDIYYNQYMNNSIKKLVNKETRKVPKNLTSILKEKSVPMENLRNFHPGIEQKLGKYGLQKSISSKLLKYALPAGLVYEGYNIWKGETP